MFEHDALYLYMIIDGEEVFFNIFDYPVDLEDIMVWAQLGSFYDDYCRYYESHDIKHKQVSMRIYNKMTNKEYVSDPEEGENFYYFKHFKRTMFAAFASVGRTGMQMRRDYRAKVANNVQK